MTRSIRTLRNLSIVGLVVIVALYVLGVLTPIGQQIGDNASLGRLAEARRLRLVDRALLEAIDVRVFIAGALFLVLLGALRHRWFAGLVIAAAYLLSILTAEVLKVILQRPVLAEAETWVGDKGGLNTFPSGHATFVTALVLGVIVLVPLGVRTVVAVTGILAIILVTGGVVTTGWHRPSDAAGGVALALTWLALASGFLMRRWGVPAGPERGPWLIPCAGAVLAAGATVVVMALLAHPEVAGALTMVTIKIALFAWVVTAVSLYGDALRAVDVVRN